MKKDLNGSVNCNSNEAPINNTENNNTAISNESKIVACKTFSNADLWNIQRQRKMIAGRRYSF